MLREMSQWGWRCFSALENGERVPSQLMDLLKKWIADKSHAWTHLGGVVDPGCLKTSPRKRKRFEKALIVAAELSARIGASMLLHTPEKRQQCSIVTLQIWLHGLQQGRTDTEILAAWNMALCNAPSFRGLNGMDRKSVWTTLDFWAQQCLDTASLKYFDKWDLSNLLTTVRFGLGDTWYMSSIRPVSTKGAMHWMTAVQSVEEILKRHLKAASKRLRHQQVERIEIAVPHIFERQTETASEWIAKFILNHEWNEEHDDIDWCASMAVPIRELGSKITLRFAPELTEKMFTQLITELPDLFVGTSLHQAAEVSDLPLNKLSIRSHRGLKKAIQDCSYATGQPSQAQLDAFSMQVPVEVKLMTTRGGTWPERRQQIIFAEGL